MTGGLIPAVEERFVQILLLEINRDCFSTNSGYKISFPSTNLSKETKKKFSFFLLYSNLSPDKNPSEKSIDIHSTANIQGWEATPLRLGSPLLIYRSSIINNALRG